MAALRPYLRRRAPIVGLAAVIAASARLSQPKPPAPSLEGLAGMLGAAAGGVVAPSDIAWEPSPGFLAESFFGRRILFLAAPERGKARDLYRARVRVTLGGQPLDVRALRNLTETPLGDDTGLQVRGRIAAFATVAYGKIQGITVLALDGIPARHKPAGLIDRLEVAITSYQDTGSFAGLGRTDVLFEQPVKSAGLRLAGDSLDVELGEERRLVFDPGAETLRADGGQPIAARAVPQVHPHKPLVLWAVDTVRAEVGPAPIAWLENTVFGAEDAVKRTAFRVFSRKSESALKGDPERVVAPTQLDADALAAHAGGWPPAAIPSLWQEVKAGEGEWVPVTLPWLEALPGAPRGNGKPPPYFYRTFIRPDVKRPYSEVELVAMDMRQLELGMQAGFEDPKPLTGPPGDGRLPRDKNILDRVVATFNGAFKTTHGAYGMMVDRRVLLPPVPGAASVVVTSAGDAGLGSWPRTDQIPSDIVSFRQNLDPLVEDGVANPTGRYIWGWQLSGTSVMTQRTALCVTPQGQLFYAWGKEIDGPTLGKALRQAGCSYGIHLDMNPAHCGFVFTDIIDLKARSYTLEKLDPGMQIASDKYLRWSAKDFFYVMVRDPVPRDPSGIRWQPDDGTQPQPDFVPGIFRGSLSIGNLEVALLSFEPGRVDWTVRAGSQEPAEAGGHLELDGDDAHRVLAAIGLGHTTPATRYGLSFGKQVPLPLRSAYATVVVSAGRAPRLIPSGEVPPLADGEQAVQLPLLAENGRLTARAQDHGSMQMRGALCVTPTGRVLVALANHDSSDPLAAALMRAGCQSVVSLDRGSRHAAFVHRTGTERPPVKGYETSVFFALGKPMEPHAFRWAPAGSTPSTKPTGYDYPIRKK
ncbi:MAG: hypothetical protein OZ921_13835 [Sorangiineae bacterium]|nr:hypothetical protein [Polyangiaceae bacterium]MEB2323588.1 hypothetical protein [Sorangiineae bacterium]